MSGLFSGYISVALPNGEICKGPWTFVSKAASEVGGVAVDNAVFSSMPEKWDLIYGPGYYVANVLGTKLYARAMLTENLGTVVNVKLSNKDNTRGNPKGVAVDNEGNIFKVSVYD